MPSLLAFRGALQKNRAVRFIVHLIRYTTYKAELKQSSTGYGRSRRMKELSKETELVLVTAVIALLTSLGIILSYAAITGADIFTWNAVNAVSAYFILAGVIWGTLIIKNS